MPLILEGKNVHKHNHTIIIYCRLFIFWNSFLILCVPKMSLMQWQFWMKLVKLLRLGSTSLMEWPVATLSTYKIKPLKPTTSAFCLFPQTAHGNKHISWLSYWLISSPSELLRLFSLPLILIFTFLQRLFLFLCYVVYMTLNNRTFQQLGNPPKISAFDMKSPVSFVTYFARSTSSSSWLCSRRGSYIISRLFRERLSTCAPV